MDDVTDLYRARLFDRQFPAVETETLDQPQPQQGFGSISEIPRNAVEQFIGHLGTALEHAGVQLDKIGVDIPKLGRVSAKDLLLGDSADFLNSIADGWYPVSGSGETMRLSGDALDAIDLAGVPGAVAGTVKTVTKGAKIIGKKAATAAAGTVAAMGAANAIEGAAK